MTMVNTIKGKKEIVLEFTKIVGEGKALGRRGGKVVFCYGVLPGETARIKIVKEKRNYIEGELVEIINPSSRRITPKEEHYLICSPWQTMDYPLQTEIKRKLAEELLYQSIKETVKLEKFYPSTEIFGYRTKIEYSFAGGGGKTHLAFRKRGNWKEKIFLPEGCALIDKKTNETALKILEKINENGIPPEKLKSLVIKVSKFFDERIAVLYVKSPDVNVGEVNIKGLVGFFIAYSNPLSPVSQVDSLVYESGKDFIKERISGRTFYYGYDCFFQNNITLFEKAIEEIISSFDKCENLIDLYSGIGIIGILVSSKAKNIYSVEVSKESVRYAKLNKRENGASNITLTSFQAEKAEENFIVGANVVILDPPRAGMHKKVVKMLLEALPEKIIYLSCNPITQGRDAAFLLEKYEIEKAVGFDFYPNTPHMETLLVFKKK